MDDMKQLLDPLLSLLNGRNDKPYPYEAGMYLFNFGQSCSLLFSLNCSVFSLVQSCSVLFSCSVVSTVFSLV